MFVLVIRWTAAGRRGAGGCWVAAAVAAAGEGQDTWSASCSTCSGRLAVIMQRQVLQSCIDSVIDGVVRQLQFIESVFLPRCEQRQVPTVALFFGLGFGM